MPTPESRTSIPRAHQPRRPLRPTVPGPSTAALALLLALAVPPASAAADGDAAPPPHPIVVELFTSQGCSSCPSADRLLTNLAEHYGDRVVALAFHVDSWNFSGWTDPFSSREWTFRQGAYNRVLGEPPYTPQMVIAGRDAMVGSDIEELKAALDAAWALPAAGIDLALQPSPSRVEVTVRVDRPQSLVEEKLQLMLALYETGLETEVGGGENGGKTLHDNYVVRFFDRIDKLKGGDGPHTGHSATVELDPAWKRSNLGVAAFLQDPRTLEIQGAARVGLDEGARPLKATPESATSSAAH